MPPRVLSLLLALAAALPAAQAATYKWVGADGRVNYGDRPPHAGASADGGPGAPASASSQPAAGGARALPYALRTASARFPVTLYTGRDCEPCETARAHLKQRGIPFSERSLSTEQDMDAFRKLGFTESAVPAVTVGREKMTGYQAGAWDRLLDAAGYPKSSQLPAGWQQSPSQPLAPSPVAAGPGAKPAAGEHPDAAAGPRQAAERPGPIAPGPFVPPAPTSLIRF